MIRPGYRGGLFSSINLTPLAVGFFSWYGKMMFYEHVIMLNKFSVYAVETLVD